MLEKPSNFLMLAKARIRPLLFIVCSLCAPPARAEDQILQLTEPLYEAFLDAARPEATRGVVGAAIVGLRLDIPSRPFQPHALRILLGRSVLKPDQLCAKFLSRDGRYYARGQYRLSKVTDPAPLLDFNTRFGLQLGGYATSDFAMFAVAGKSCEDLNGARLFVVHNGDLAAARRLLVQIRAGDARVHAQLGRDNAAVSPAVLCEKNLGEPSVGFSAECALTLPTPVLGGDYQLSIGETGSSGEMVVRAYSVVLDNAVKDEAK